jgi:hypothetical protein
MARFANVDRTPVDAAVDLWRDSCLVEDGSLFFPDAGRESTLSFCRLRIGNSTAAVPMFAMMKSSFKNARGCRRPHRRCSQGS